MGQGPPSRPIPTALVAVPETAGSALYGLLDVLQSAGSAWQAMARTGHPRRWFDVKVVSPGKRPFRCGHGIPVVPDCSIREATDAEILIVPELWLGPDEPLGDRHPALIEWIRERYAAGAWIYSACSGSLALAETGLLDGREATSHWGYQDLFRRRFPSVRFRPEPSLCFADPAGRLVTAGGTTSWHDLALHIVARHVTPGEALRIAKVYLLKVHTEGQLPYAQLVRPQPHQDPVARTCEERLQARMRERNPVASVVADAGVPERTLKRRFKLATGLSLLDYLQNLRVEAAKRQLEGTSRGADDIGRDVGYDDASFFRRLFKRRTGLSPGQYRRMFQEGAQRIGGRSAHSPEPAASGRTATR